MSMEFLCISVFCFQLIERLIYTSPIKCTIYIITYDLFNTFVDNNLQSLYLQKKNYLHMGKGFFYERFRTLPNCILYITLSI